MPIDALTIPERVTRRAMSDGHRTAYTFLTDGAGEAQSITWAQLHQRASELAALWHARGVAGQPVLLAMPSGLRFVEALMACWYAGGIAVPISLPRHARVRHRLDRVVSDANAKFVIGLDEHRPLFQSDEGKSITDLVWLEPREAAPASTAALPKPSQPVAVLQYTSGSTGSPRGVVVTHANLTHNSALIASACGHGPGQTIGGWLPMFHDMGLVGLLIQAAYSGSACVFMSPERFLMRPWLWLQMITDYKLCSSPAPNFAYDLCVDRITDPQKARLDLSHWKHALSGAEPVRARTLERFTTAFSPCGFSTTTFFPCYGLAEATLFVTGPAAGSGAAVIDNAGRVACGSPLGDTQLAIVDPQTKRRVADAEIGEIWVSGSSCAHGYWNDPDRSQEVFQARLDNIDPQPGQRDWLRTGDLAYVQNGNLFITGRLRDLIIVAGRNLFPADLEQTVEAAHPAIASSGVAAFSVDVKDTERLIIAAELRRELSKESASADAALLEPAKIRQAIIAAVVAEHGVAPSDVVLLRSGALPRTTSGKLRRGTAREQYLALTLTPFTFSTERHHVACA